MWRLTFVLRGEFPHLWGEAFVELVLPGDERLADGFLPKSQHAGVAPHLVHEGLKHHPFSGVWSPVCLHEGFQSRTHSHSASDSRADGTHAAGGARKSTGARLAPYPCAFFLGPHGGAAEAKRLKEKTKGWTGRAGVEEQIRYFPLLFLVGGQILTVLQWTGYSPCLGVW